MFRDNENIAKKALTHFEEWASKTGTNYTPTERSSFIETFYQTIIFIASAKETPDAQKLASLTISQFVNMIELHIFFIWSWLPRPKIKPGRRGAPKLLDLGLRLDCLSCMRSMLGLRRLHDELVLLPGQLLHQRYEPRTRLVRCYSSFKQGSLLHGDRPLATLLPLLPERAIIDSYTMFEASALRMPD